jgi:hypothetical protein
VQALSIGVPGSLGLQFEGLLLVPVAFRVDGTPVGIGWLAYKGGHANHRHGVEKRDGKRIGCGAHGHQSFFVFAYLDNSVWLFFCLDIVMHSVGRQGNSSRLNNVWQCE